MKKISLCTAWKNLYRPCWTIRLPPYSMAASRRIAARKVISSEKVIKSSVRMAVPIAFRSSCALVTRLSIAFQTDSREEDEGARLGWVGLVGAGGAGGVRLGFAVGVEVGLGLEVGRPD